MNGGDTGRARRAAGTQREPIVTRARQTAAEAGAVVLRSVRELEALREAGRVVAQVLAVLAALIAPGVTTLALDEAAEDVIRRAGGVPTFKGYQGFPAAMCVSVNAEVVHGIPDGRRLRPGDLVSCDVGATLGGYIGDGAWTFSVEPVSEASRRLLAVTREALESGIAAAQPGARVGDIGAAVQRVAEGAGYSVVRKYCGHGVGTSMHEPPQVPNYGVAGSGPLLRPGMVIAIEPMVNVGVSDVRVLANRWTVVTRDGLPSAHFEHTVAIREDGPEILTSL